MEFSERQVKKSRSQACSGNAGHATREKPDGQDPCKVDIRARGKRTGMRSGDEQWIAEVSHELRLPIANIKLLVDTLLDGALDDLPIARKMLARARSEADRLHRLTETLLSLEQVSSHRDIHCQWVHLESRVRYALESTGKLAMDRSVSTQMQIASDFHIYANPEQFDQVLLNLVENAIKFTPENGKVTIRQGKVPGSFSVEDNGIGMPEHEIPKIFTRF